MTVSGPFRITTAPLRGRRTRASSLDPLSIREQALELALMRREHHWPRRGSRRRAENKWFTTAPRLVLVDANEVRASASSTAAASNSSTTWTSSRVARETPAPGPISTAFCAHRSEFRQAHVSLERLQHDRGQLGRVGGGRISGSPAVTRPAPTRSAARARPSCGAGCVERTENRDGVAAAVLVPVEARPRITPSQRPERLPNVRRLFPQHRGRDADVGDGGPRRTVRGRAAAGDRACAGRT